MGGSRKEIPGVGGKANLKEYVILNLLIQPKKIHTHCNEQSIHFKGKENDRFSVNGGKDSQGKQLVYKSTNVHHHIKYLK